MSVSASLCAPSEISLKQDAAQDNTERAKGSAKTLLVGLGGFIYI
jgi:hypothetical protein